MLAPKKKELKSSAKANCGTNSVIKDNNPTKAAIILLKMFFISYFSTYL